MFSRGASRAVSSIPPCCRAASTRASSSIKDASKVATARAPYRNGSQSKRRNFSRSLLIVAVAGGFATIAQQNYGRQTYAESPESPEQDSLVFEKSRKKQGASKEENRDLISSQHHQVKRSWENPGVYAWGSNIGRVVAPDSTDNAVKTPRRIRFFDGKLLRDIKLDRTFGAAIDERGDLYQWGTGYSADIKDPVTTLKGKNLVSLSISKDRILGLSKNGKVYSIPVSASEQESGSKPSEASWIPFWSYNSPIAYRTITPAGLKSSESIKLVASGLEHGLLLTSKGRLFSFASASDAFPGRGQLGVPGLTWVTRPAGDFDQPHEITTLRGFEIASVACGDNHSLALDKDGRIFTWGDNIAGQLGFDYNPDSSIVDAPSLLPLQKLYTGTSQVPIVTKIAAGGNNSYFTVDATKVASQISYQSRADPAEEARQNRGLGKTTADTFAFGTGIMGNLANNRWTHVQSTPAKIPSLSGLFEYNETTNTTVPIRLAHLSVGATHAAAVMGNITNTTANLSTPDDTNWGADIVFWGGNEHYQLGTGKRNNQSFPTYLQPLDSAAELVRAKKSTGAKEEHRFHITPRAAVKLPDGRKVSMEQRVECGRSCTAVYSST
ncbi:hypothetical protein MBLNU230_g1308t1 [Neophaeotheca triangularis]